MNGAPPLLRVVGLWQHSSMRDGAGYRVGRIGSAKILVLPNRDRKGDDDPTHVLYLTQATERPNRPRGDGTADSATRVPPRRAVGDIAAGDGRPLPERLR
jgi:hypothetical protein